MASSSSKSKVPTKPTKKEVTRNGINGFRSREEFDWWSFYFDKKPVVIERPVQIKSFQDFPHQRAFTRRPGWVAYLADSGNMCNMTICTEFIASLIQDDPMDDYSFTARVRNKFVYLNPETLGRIMNIEPLDENFEFPYQEHRRAPGPNRLATFLRGHVSEWGTGYIEKKDIHKDNYVLWLIVANAIQPTSHTNLLSPQQARIMEAIAANKQFCLVRFFIRQIAWAIDSTSKNEAIKMGVLITRLCIEAGVEVRNSDDQKIQRQPLNQSTVRRSEAQRKNVASGSGQGQGDDSDGADTAEHGEHEQQTEVPRQRRRGGEGTIPLDMEAIMAQFQQMNQTMTTEFQHMRGEQQIIRDNQDQMRAEMTDGFAYLRGEIESWKTQFPPYPPPDM